MMLPIAARPKKASREHEHERTRVITCSQWGHTPFGASERSLGQR
jgi:hypothetical protein